MLPWLVVVLVLCVVEVVGGILVQWCLWVVVGSLLSLVYLVWFQPVEPLVHRGHTWVLPGCCSCWSSSPMRLRRMYLVVCRLLVGQEWGEVSTVVPWSWVGSV